MRKKVVLLFALLLVLVIATGCSAEKKALEAGKEALANEDLDEAKEQFIIAMDKGNDEAKQYMEIIEAAEEFVADVVAKDYDTALESIKTVREHKLYNDIKFITAEAEEELDMVIEKRKEIDENLKSLQSKFKEDAKESKVKKSLLRDAEEILADAYISEEQTNETKDLIEQIEKQLTKQAEAEREVKKKAEKERKEKEQDEKEKEEKEAEDETEDKPETEVETSPKEEGNNGKLSTSEAEKVLFDYLKKEIPEEQLTSSQLKMNYDHEDEQGNYVFQLFETVIDNPETGEGHAATWGWYTVNPKTKEVKELY